MDPVKTQQWWMDSIVGPIMNSHRLNFSLIEHQIKSYEQFVFKYIPEIVSGYSKIVFWIGPIPPSTRLEILPQDRRQYATHFIKFQLGDIQYRPSDTTVKTCHLQNETYKFDVLTNVNVSILDLTKQMFLLSNHRLFTNIVLCSIPIMVRSKMCNAYLDAPATEILDPGGYFVLRGKEKVVLAQEDFKHNFPVIGEPTATDHTGRYSWKCEVRSSHFPKIRSTSTVYILMKKQTNDIDIELPFCGTFMPVLSIYRMMGLEDRADILHMLAHGSTDARLMEILVKIVDNDVRHVSRDDLAQTFVPKTSTVEKVIEHSQHKLKSLFQNSLTNEFFPHIGTQWAPEINMRKLMYLSFCIRKLCLVVLHRGQKPTQVINGIVTGRGKHVPDSRDILDNKRIKCTGYNLGLLFRMLFRDYSGGIYKNIRRKFNKLFMEQSELAATTPSTSSTVTASLLHQFILQSKQLLPLFEHNKITDQLIYVIASGNWIANKQRHRIITITSKSKFMNNESKTAGQASAQPTAMDQSGFNNPNNRAGTENRQTFATDQTGVSQSLTRHYPMTVLSHLRRVNKTINKKSKSIAPRLLNESQWGIYCGVSTPEGRACGLLPQLALMCHIRHVSLSTIDMIIQVTQILATLQLTPGWITIFVNYVPLRSIQPEHIHLVIETLKQDPVLPFDVSIYVNETDDVVPQLHIVYDEGACLRPLLNWHRTTDLIHVVETTPIENLWHELIRRRMIEFKTKEEEFCGQFAVSANIWSAEPNHTHVEIYDAALFSPEIQIIPFMNHNQSPRNMFAMNLLRQSVADIGYNHMHRFDPHNHRLWYPQRPLVQTSQDRDWNLSEIPSGVNCVVQMMCMPYNMEDAIVVNGASIERGLFRSDVFETYESQDDPDNIVFAKPDFHSITNLQNANYQTVDEDGLPAKGQTISKRDVLIGRVSYHDSKAVKQAQQHAADATKATTADTKNNIPSVVKSVSIASTGQSITSSKAISSVKTVVSEQSEQDMKTLREHLSWIHQTSKPDQRSRLAILENLQSPSSQSNRVATVKPSFQKDHSIVMQKELFDQHMVVDEALVSQPSSDQRIVKVRLRQMRIPEIGDKVSSRHGQKSVIGRIMRPEDMPFTLDGQVADLIVNPHCMPSRMTIGQLLESLSGKAIALDDQPHNHSTVLPCDSDSSDYFGSTPVNLESHSLCCHKTLPKISEYAKVLRKKGYDVYGNEPMYDATTGRLLQNKDATGRTFMNEAIFIGVVYYHRLRHMVSDKLYARAKGSVQLTTRQPNEGRSAEGGLRMGEMERDVFVSHGATQVIRDRWLHNSDYYDTVICNTCGSFANKASWTCSVCHDKADLRNVVVPYAAKLLKQELASSGVYLQFSSQQK